MVLSADTLKDPENIGAKFEFPIFVKPANLGSSVGISKAHNDVELKTAILLAASFDRKVILERGITGREFECAVLGNNDPIAAAPCEILPSREFYDYDDKYLLDKAGTVIPADLSKEKTAETRTSVCILSGGQKLIQNGVIAILRLKVSPNRQTDPARIQVERAIAVSRDVKQVSLRPVETVVTIR